MIRVWARSRYTAQKLVRHQDARGEASLRLGRWLLHESDDPRSDEACVRRGPGPV